MLRPIAVETEDADGPQGLSAYRRLLDDIRRGVLPPGARLRETEIAERFGISATCRAKAPRSAPSITPR
jgi:DNA-binding GntR family transcriptional regulator